MLAPPHLFALEAGLFVFTELISDILIQAKVMEAVRAKL